MVFKKTSKECSNVVHNLSMTDLYLISLGVLFVSSRATVLWPCSTSWNGIVVKIENEYH